METEINGKRVVLRDKLGAKANYDLMPMLEEIGHRAQKEGGITIRDLKYEEMRDLIMRFVLEWDFDGDPADPTSYDELDLISEFMVLGAEAMTAFGKTQDTKN